MCRPAVSEPAFDVCGAIHMADGFLAQADANRAEQAGDYRTETTDGSSPMHGEHECRHDDIQYPRKAEDAEHDHAWATEQGDKDAEG